MFRFNPRRVILLFCALAILLPLTPAISSHAGRHAALHVKRKQARHKLVKIKHQIATQRAALRQTKNAQKALSGAIRVNKANLGKAQLRLAQLQAQLASAERDLAAGQQRLDAAQRRLRYYIVLLRRRLIDIYKHGAVSYAVVMLQSRDLWDLTSRGYLLEQMVRHDVTLLCHIRAEKAVIAAQTAQQRARRVEIARLNNEVAQQVRVIAQRIAEQRQVQEDLRRERARLEAGLAELEQNSREVEQMLRAFESQPDITQRIPHPWLGSFMRPVGGRVTSGFGMRYHPILHVTKLHTGVDLAASYGMAIHAAGDGVVVHAGYWGGYGNCVVIAHGNGRSTLYGHCSSLCVSAGQHVRRGQVVGRVGSTGFSTGPHLHFEVRRNGTPVNPLSQ